MVASGIKVLEVYSQYCWLLSCLQERHTKRWKHLAALANLSFALKEKLDDMNRAAFTNFKLKIGSFIYYTVT